MSFLTLADKIIPGYSLLDDSVQTNFQNTLTGDLFVTNCNNLLTTQSNRSIFSSFWSGYEDNQTIKTIKENLKDTNDYKTLIIQIKCKLLYIHYPDSHLLPPEQLILLAGADCSHELYLRLIHHDSLFDASLGNPDAIHDVLQDFQTAFNKTDDLAPLRETIALHKQHSQEQAKTNTLDKLYDSYEPNQTKETPAIQHEEVNQLALFLAACMAIEHHNKTLNLDQFNASQALLMASRIAKKNYQLDEHMIDDYKHSLLDYIHHNMGAYNPFESPSINQITTDSLSYLYSICISNNNRELFMSTLDQLSDAHAFIQATGFATQNENSLLSWIDIYNYTRTYDNLAEAKTMLSKFLMPFMPILNEYRDITHREHNIIRQIIRTLIPMLIVASVIILVATLLSPLLFTEVTFLFILFPTVYIALALASCYVVTKDYVYHSTRQWYFGGQFELPEYQVNERLLLGFKSPEQATTIRTFYVNAIRLCDETEKHYQSRLTAGLLTDAELIDRKKNITKRDLLQLEWFDIHSNTLIGYDRLPHIACNRLNEEGRETYSMLQEEWAQRNEEDMTEWAKGIGEHIQTVIRDQSRTPKESSIATERHRLFKSCLNHQTKIEALHTLQKTL
jgi:hypothetical protein